VILVDTSIWVDLQRGAASHLSELLNADLVVTHPFVIGELVCGTPANRPAFLGFLKRLERCNVAREDEVLLFIEMHKLYGAGIGYIDAHLLTSAAIDRYSLWTRDKRLARIAAILNINYPDRP
jgi:predicted nucleic acid-binding protein